MTEDEIKALQKQVEDLTAERDSFKTENDKITAQNKTLSEELKKTKELNFTLARKIDVSGKKKSAEDLINDMFK